MPDTPANRQAFGSAGTADDSSPYPQQRDLWLSHASTRAALAVASGPSGAAASGGRDKGEAEQALLDKALKDYPHLFTPQRLWIMDRNFPGVPRIARLLGTGTHVLIRVKDGITLERTGDFLPDGSYRAAISGGGIMLDGPRHRIPGQRRRGRRPRAVLPHHRPARPRRLPGGRAGRRLPLAVDRVGDLAEGSQVRDQRRRAVHRRDAPLPVPGPDRPGARRLGDRHRPGPRGGPRRRGPGCPRWQRQARLRARPPPPDIVHRRPARDHHHHPHGRSYRQPACPGDHREPRPRPGRPAAAVSMWIATGTATARPKRGWASRLAARAFPPRLRSPRSASASRSPPEPCPPAAALAASPVCTRRPVEPAAARSDSRAAATPAHRSHSPSNTPQATSDSAASAQNARSRSSTWHWPEPRNLQTARRTPYNKPGL